MKNWVKCGITQGNLMDALDALDDDAVDGDSIEDGDDDARWAKFVTEII